VIAARAGISAAAARQALLAHEKNGTATRVKGSRPGIADTWTPATAPAVRADEAQPAETPGASTPGDGQPAAAPAGSTADSGQPDPAPAGGTAGDQQADVGPEPGPDPVVTAEAAGTVAAIAQAADEAGKALAAGNLDVALAAWRPPATSPPRDGGRSRPPPRAGVPPRPGPGRCATWSRSTCASSRRRPSPRIRSARCSPGRPRAVANALDKLVSLGVAEMVTDKPRTYQFATVPAAADAVGDPTVGAEETAASAA
jgi:hypothetical protein